MKPAAQKANEIRAALDELPQGFAQTLVADYIAQLHPEKKLDMFQLIKKMLDRPAPARREPLIPLEIA